MSIIGKQGVCPYCGWDHDRIVFPAPLPQPDVQAAIDAALESVLGRVRSMIDEDTHNEFERGENSALGTLEMLIEKAVGQNPLADLQAQLSKAQALHNELLYAVVCKFPNETRHETALRYIQERESREVACESPSMKEPDK